MSHNYPYRRSPENVSSHQGAFSTTDHLHHEKRHIYQNSLQPSPRSMSVFTSQKSVLESYSSRSSTTTNSALSLLSSCGLEPEDLSVLAGMPENMITEESLPRVLMEIRQKKGLSDRSRLSSTHRSTSHQPLQPPSDSWENSARSASAKYLANPPQHSSYPPIPPPRSSYPLPREEPESWKDRWGNPRQSGAVRQEKTSSTYVVDYNYGLTQEGDSRNIERPVGIGERPHLQSSSHYQQLNPGKEPAAAYQKKLIPPLANTVHSTPKAREANDFHGSMPQTFPYACSLCDIAVLSQKDWTLHINGAQHANSQLAVLQKYPKWDCRTVSARQSDYNSEKGSKGKNTGGRRNAAPQHHGDTSSREGKSYPIGDKASGRVVCVKYAANSMDEHSIRRLVGQVGSAVNVMMFPVQAFIEMSSPDEAQDVVKYFNRNQVVIEGSLVEFSLSATYNFLQNSPVVIFSLLPPGHENYPEIMDIAKRFGPVKHSLFLSNRVLLEMGSREDAGKLVQYYTSHPLKMKGNIIQVSHSTNHSTLKFAVTDKETEGGEASRHISQSNKSQTRSSPSPRRRSPSPRRAPGPRRRSPSPRRRPSYTRRRSPSPRTSYSSRRSSPTPRRRSCSPRRRSPSPRRRSPIKRKRSPGDRRRSLSPMRKSLENRDVNKVEDKTSQVRKQSSSRHMSHTKEDNNKSGVHSIKKTVNNQNSVVKGIGVLTETPDMGSSQEPSCTTTLIKESVPSPTEHTQDHGTGQKTEDQTMFEEGKDSDMDSDIEGMAVIGEDEEIRSEEGSMEFLDDMEEHDVCDEAGTSADNLSTCPSEVVEAGEKEKQAAGGEELAVHPDKEPGSQSLSADPAVSQPPGVLEAQEEKQEEGQEDMEEPHETYDEDEPDFPESLDHCITLDELEDEDSEGQSLVSEGNSDQRSKEKEQENDHGRVIYIQNLPSGYYTDKQFVAIGKKYGKVNRYFLIRRRQEGFIEMERSADARRAVRKLSEKLVKMARNILVVHLSRKYKRLTCGWSPESDSEDERGWRKHQRKSRRKGEREDSSSRTKSRKEEEPPSKKVCIREEKTTPAKLSSSIKAEEKSATEEPSSNKEQQQEEKAVTEEPSSNKEQQQEEEEKAKAVTEEPSSNKEQQQEEEEKAKAVTEEPSINNEQQQEEEEKAKAVTEEPSINKEQQQEEEEKAKAVTEEPSSNKEQQQEEKAVTEEPSSNKEQQQEEEGKAVTEETSSHKEQQQEDEEKAVTEEPSSKKEQQQEEEEKAVTEEPSSHKEQQQEEEEKAVTEEPSSHKEQQQDEEEKVVTEETSSHKERQQEEEEKAVTEEPSSHKEHEEGEKGMSKRPCEQEEFPRKTENENIMISQPSDSRDTLEETEGETSIENPDGIKPVCVKEEKVEMMTETTHVPLGPYLPNNPMGREFVSQKIGYFCSLCNAIYVTEDEARNEHCSSHSHYEKLKAYMEQKGNPAGQF